MSGVLLWRWCLIVEMLMDERSAAWAAHLCKLCIVKFKIRLTSIDLGWLT
jgi:hypothetical protein